MITTPEQMREAAAKCCDINNISPNFSAPAQSISTAMAIAAAIRAIPIAPQPVAVTVKPLVWVPEDAICTRFKAEALGGHMMIVELDLKTDPGRYSVGFDLGGLCFKFVLAEYDDFPPKYTAPAKFDTLDDAKAAAQADYEARILSALTIQPADPLSDPRVVALVEALTLASNRLAWASIQFDTGTQNFITVGEWAHEALRAIGGEE